MENGTPFPSLDETEPCSFAGTKFPVRSVVHYVLRQGMSPEELVKEFGHLTLAQVHDALSYYYDHQIDMDRELEEYTEERVRSDLRG